MMISLSARLMSNIPVLAGKGLLRYFEPWTVPVRLDGPEGNLTAILGQEPQRAGGGAVDLARRVGYSGRF